MANLVRRQQTAITIRSTRAAELLRQLVRPDRSQADVIEEALERLVARPQSARQALMPKERMDFNWEPPRGQIMGRPVDLND